MSKLFAKKVHFLKCQFRALMVYFFLSLFLTVLTVSAAYGTINEKYFSYYVYSETDEHDGWVSMIIVFVPFVIMFANCSFIIAAYHTLFNKETANKIIGSYLTLPIGRKTIFGVKYCLVILCTFINVFIAFFLATVIPAVIGIKQFNITYVFTNLLNYLSLFLFLTLFFVFLIFLDHIFKNKTSGKLVFAILLMIYSCLTWISKGASLQLASVFNHNDIQDKIKINVYTKIMYMVQYFSPVMLLSFFYMANTKNLIVLDTSTSFSRTLETPSAMLYAPQIIVALFLILLFSCLYFWKVLKKDFLV